MVIDFDIKPEDMQDVFDIIEFLESNKDVIISDIKPMVADYLDRQPIFNGPFLTVFNDEFDNFIVKQLRDTVGNNFEELNVERLNVLVDRELLEILGVLDLFNDRNLYRE